MACVIRKYHVKISGSLRCLPLLFLYVSVQRDRSVSFPDMNFIILVDSFILGDSILGSVGRPLRIAVFSYSGCIEKEDRQYEGS